MERVIAALLMAAVLASCAAQDRPSPTTGGFEQGPRNSPNPSATQQPPDNYP